jgi:hypothetical protein
MRPEAQVHFGNDAVLYFESEYHYRFGSFDANNDRCGDAAAKASDAMGCRSYTVPAVLFLNMGEALGLRRI